MKLTHIVETKQQLIEQHKRNSLMLLVESTQGLDRDQQQVVENVYRHFLPLIEASLSKEQIQQIFTNVEQGATAAGGNRTAIGKSKDVVDKVNTIISDAGKWLQDTTPVKNFDARFEKLKNDINKKFPDSKILDGISQMGIWAKENPGKTAAIVGILTALASLAGGPIGGAIAGQVLRGSVELLKGEKLSTAIGKGVKTAVFGFLSGKAFEMLGKFAEGIRIKSLPFGPENAGFEEVTFGASKTLTAPGMEWTETIEGVDIIVDPEMASAVRSATNMIRMGGDAASEGFEQLQSAAEIISSAEYKKEIMDALEISRQELLKNDSLLNFIKTAKEGLQAASQGAVAAAGVASDGKEKKESIRRVGRKLSEGQVYMLFKRVDVAQDYLAEAGFLSKVGGAIKGAVGKLGQKVATTGKNLTTKVTADKLNSAWQKAGSPTDTEELFNFLTQQGVSKEVIAPVYDTMKLPVPKSVAQDEPADDKQAAAGAAGQKLNPAKAKPGQEPKPGTVGLQTQPGETPQGQSGSAASGASGANAAAQDEPAADQSSNKTIDVVALANEIKASDPNITGDVKKLLDDDLKRSQKQQAKPAADQTQPAPATV
jgi:hypothetical protein